MSSKLDKIPINNKELDKRVKLTDKQREEIKENPHGLSQRALARMYKVDRRTISFILNPEALKQNKERRKERGGSKQYYNRENNRIAMKKHRDYKKSLMKKGLLKDSK